MLIVLDPGHGGNDSGAVGNNFLEKDINLNISLKLKDIVKSKNINVIMTRDKDISLGLQERCDIANKNKADYFISIHCNGFKDTSAKGTETYSYPGSIIGAKLAVSIQRSIVSMLNTIDRGTKTANFYVLHHTDMPAILIETGFITHFEDVNLLVNKPNLFATAISNGIFNFLGLQGVSISDDIEKLHQGGLINDYHDPESYVKWKDFASVILKLIGGYKK
ncbi:N-acetylmuramoyl-L-alanine amidase [Thermoanaerobacterium sp. RBIITD]|uniref:N-acetylmuramoyl-L-alanine amidase family protein n=1 Tax=Thermoanaerobacterium sp. RBIITD TaxID=1550240 RepID=UPI000BB75C64|nr:N-acetylmuramoyl-L-alanine amidase [Thermoanaerobacterium sp. RBIITD]SNX54242.1 N-acetylmuramoyl-L-alanine amidase [Thermoanaerobacterium sp. RBIITD]